MNKIYRHLRAGGNPTFAPHLIGKLVSRLRGNDDLKFVFAVAAVIFFSPMAQAEILIGVAGPMSGTSAIFGTQMLQGVQAAVDQLNSTGGIEGELVEVVSVDDACDNRKAEIAAQSLVEKHVAVVIGHFCSYPSLAAGKIYESAGIPMIAPSGSLPALTDAGLSNIIRLVSRDDAQGAYAALRMNIEFAAHKIAVVSDGSAVAEALVARFKAASGTAPAWFFTIKPAVKSVDDLMVGLAAKDIAALYCACAASDAGFIASQITAAGLGLKVYGPDSLLAPQYWEKSGDSGEGTFVSFAVDPQLSSEARKLIKLLAAADIKAEAPVLQSYAAVQVYAQAVEKIGAKNSTGVNEYLHSGASFSTVLGSLSFDAKGDVREPRLVWYVWSKGKFATEYLVK